MAGPRARPCHLYRLERRPPRRLFLGLRRGRTCVHCMVGPTRPSALRTDIFSLYTRLDYDAGRSLPMVRRQRFRRTHGDRMLRRARYVRRHAHCARTGDSCRSVTGGIGVGAYCRTGCGPAAGSYASVLYMVARRHVRPAGRGADGAGRGKRAHLPAYRTTALAVACRIRRRGRAVGQADRDWRRSVACADSSARPAWARAQATAHRHDAGCGSDAGAAAAVRRARALRAGDLFPHPEARCLCRPIDAGQTAQLDGLSRRQRLADHPRGLRRARQPSPAYNSHACARRGGLVWRNLRIIGCPVTSIC